MKVARIVIVNNGVEKISFKAIKQVHVIETIKNLGTSGGFPIGIKKAISLGCDFIWILDDDNFPERTCLSSLMYHMANLQKQYTLRSIILMPYRAFLFRNIFLHQSEREVFSVGPMKNSFLGFHYLQLFAMFRNRLRGNQSKRQLSRIGVSPIRLDTGYYGGIFFHKSVYQSISPPNEKYFIYWDDMEYIHRFHQNGGHVYLLPECRIDDLDASTTEDNKKHFLHHPFIDLKPRFKAYYYIRNLMLYERRWSDSPSLIYFVNRAIMSVFIVLIGLIRWEPGRIKLLFIAIEASKRFSAKTAS